MNKETFRIVVSEGRNKPKIDEYQVESDNIFKLVAETIAEYMEKYTNKSLYFSVFNKNKHEENFTAVNRDDKTFVTYSSSIRWAFGNEYIDWDMEPKYLTCLDEEKNEYKYYVLRFDKETRRVNAQYGRIGMNAGEFRYADGCDSKDGMYAYPPQMFWIKYYEKLAKGYIDNSDLKNFDDAQIRVKEMGNYAQIKDVIVNRIIMSLISQQRDYVQKAYDLDAPFSEQAVNKAKSLLLEMANNVADKPEFIRLYKELVMTLPRKIYNVAMYINRVDFSDSESDNYVEKIISAENDLLDNFCSLYIDAKTEEPDTSLTILEARGLTIRPAAAKERLKVYDKMGEDAYKVSEVLCVENKKTRDELQKYVSDKGLKKKDCHLLWHGSRNENWWSIISNGLSLRPNAAITGKMFGNGLYFATRAKKSLGYTDIRGSYWAGGNQNKAYLALYNVVMGKSYEPTHALGSDFYEDDLMYGCHSVWAYPKNTGLVNEECVVYNEAQADIEYPVEVDYDLKPFSFSIRNVKKTKFENIVSCDTSVKADCEFSGRKAQFEYEVASDTLAVYIFNEQGDRAPFRLSKSEQAYLKCLLLSRV